jgi:hypothetical protein
MGIAVFDIGKTNVKLSLVEAGDIRHNLVALNRWCPARLIRITTRLPCGHS